MTLICCKAWKISDEKWNNSWNGNWWKTVLQFSYALHTPLLLLWNKEVAPSLTTIEMEWRFLLLLLLFVLFFFFSEFHNSEDHVDNSFWIKDLLCHRHRRWTEVLFVLYKLNLYLMVLSFWRDLQNSFSLPLSKKIFWSLRVAVENDSLRGLKMEPKEKMKWMMTSCFLFFFTWKTFRFLVLIYEDSFAFFSGRC